MKNTELILIAIIAYLIISQKSKADKPVESVVMPQVNGKRYIENC